MGSEMCIRDRNISRYAPAKGFQSFNIDITKLVPLAHDLIVTANTLAKAGLLEKEQIVEMLEDLKYEL